MSSTSFRLETFRPWNPFQDKAQPLLDPPGICRYPSPISITATPPPLKFSDQVSKSQKIHSHNPERHPLPARPPMEVCLDGLHSESQTTRQESEGLDQTTSAINYPDSFDFVNILQPQNLSGTDDVDFATFEDNICQRAEHQFPELGSDGSEPAVFAGQRPQAVDSGNPIETRELPNIETIDPAILNDHDSPGAGHVQTTENITGITTHPEEYPGESARFRNKAPPLQHRRQNANGTMDRDCQSSTTMKCSGVGKRRTRSSSGRYNKGSGHRQSVSSSTVRAQFSALSVEDRLQFLSWLFEGALPRCVSTPSSADVNSPSRCISSQDIEITYDCDHTSLNTELTDAQHTLSTRKGLP
ncbi:hypothetical protein PENANT_c030G01554, partial [Penicillium antarcticum]